MRRRYSYPLYLDWFTRRQLYECNMPTRRNENYSVGQSWKALKKCWVGYKIAKNQMDYTNMLKYATRIQKLQWELDEPCCSFPNLGLFKQ